MSIATTAAIAAATVALAAAATQLLPRNIEVVRAAHVDLTPAQVLELATSTEGYQTFNPYQKSDPTLKISAFGPATGVGSGFAFEGKEGKGTQTIARVTETSVHYDIDLGAMGQPKQSISVAPDGEGAMVTWTMHSDLGRNPIFRVFGLFMNGMVGKTFEQGLANLNNAA
ncbi:MAG: SRPBCC family protein [Shimia sp.]